MPKTTHRPNGASGGKRVAKAGVQAPGQDFAAGFATLLSKLALPRKPEKGDDAKADKKGAARWNEDELRLALEIADSLTGAENTEIRTAFRDADLIYRMFALYCLKQGVADRELYYGQRLPVYRGNVASFRQIAGGQQFWPPRRHSVA